jgi:hypothetical protein
MGLYENEKIGANLLERKLLCFIVFIKIFVMYGQTATVTDPACASENKIRTRMKYPSTNL